MTTIHHLDINTLEVIYTEVKEPLNYHDQITNDYQTTND